MDPLSQFLQDSSSEEMTSMDRTVKLATAVGNMNHEELLETLDTLNGQEQPAPQEFPGNLSLEKVAFIASVGAGRRIAPEMIKEAGVWKYILKGAKQLGRFIKGKSSKGVPFKRTEALGGFKKKIIDDYGAGASKALTPGEGFVPSAQRAALGVAKVVRDNPGIPVAAGAAAGTGLAGVGGLKGLKWLFGSGSNSNTNTVNNYR